MAEVAAAAATATLRETPLARLHRELGARMVPFAGYSMPVQYPTGIIAEHLWTRAHAGLFDVSHMGPCFLALDHRDSDADAEAKHRAIAAIAESLVCGDIAGLNVGQLRYTLLMDDQGGVIDDLMIGHAQHIALIVNASLEDLNGRTAFFAALFGYLHDRHTGKTLRLAGVTRPGRCSSTGAQVAIIHSDPVHEHSADFFDRQHELPRRPVRLYQRRTVFDQHARASRSDSRANAACG